MHKCLYIYIYYTFVDYIVLFSLATGEKLPPTVLPVQVKNVDERYNQANCLQGNGTSYTGTLSVTLHGHTCLEWNLPKVKALSVGKGFDPKVLLVKNYCRNPDGDLEGPWCYVKQGANITMDYCDLELCGKF